MFSIGEQQQHSFARPCSINPSELFLDRSHFCLDEGSGRAFVSDLGRKAAGTYPVFGVGPHKARCSAITSGAGLDKKHMQASLEGCREVGKGI